MTPHPERPLFEAQPKLAAVLKRLHSQSLEQEASSKPLGAHYVEGSKVPKNQSEFDDYYRDKYVAIDEDKARYIYITLLSTNARRIIEAGTSFGVSTLYLLAAVHQNISNHGVSPLPSRVWATEIEPKKAKVAVENVCEAMEGYPKELKILEGDLIKTIPEESIEPRSVDALLLDIWAPLAFPTLNVVLPLLRPGAIVFVDNVITAASRYVELHNFLADRKNGFETSVLPYNGGLSVSVFCPPVEK